MPKSSLTVGDRLEVYIEKLVFHGGRGLARTPDGVIFVDGAAPEEQVQIQISKVQKNYAEGFVTSILAASEFRVVPECPYYQNCGGCNLQHVNYQRQILQKQKILEDQLRKLRKLYSEFRILEFLPSKEIFHYRSRAQFHIKNQKLGFFKRNSHEIENITECKIVDSTINSQLKELRKDIPKDKVRIELYAHSLDEEPTGFFSQVNRSQNLILKEIVGRELEIWTRSNSLIEFWDLYGGAGNFSLPLAKMFADIHFVCIEASSEAVKFGQRLKNSMGLTNFDFFDQSIEKFLSGKAPKQRFILVDPPRAGMSPSALEKLIPLLKDSVLLYMSCNPSTFTRDAESLLLKTNLSLRWVQGIDMFPQTDHIELISCFAPKVLDSL